MEENVQKEIEGVRGMVLTWKKSYLRETSPGEGDEFLAEEFMEEITTYVYPFVKRMHMCNHITQSEANEFLDFCYSQVQDLRNTLKASQI